MMIKMTFGVAVLIFIMELCLGKRGKNKGIGRGLIVGGVLGILQKYVKRSDCNQNSP